MNAALYDWLQETRRTYFGNAAAQRDFRVQFRGNRSAILFGLYLALLIAVAWFKYTEIESRAFTIAEIQRQLRDFYMLIVFLLGGVVSIVAPGLAATAVVAERQRRSLDLIFSGPVPPRYYLVGKMIASYRYTWMLLILSLPVTAACVVLGGASWSDVLTVYGLLSIHGLLYAAIGLMMSTICPKPVTAVLWTYLSVGGVLALTTSAGMAYSSRPLGNEASFLVGLSPISSFYAVGTHTTLLGLAIPNALIAFGAVLIAVRLCLLGAGSVLSEGRETVNLRASWGLVVAASAFALGRWLGVESPGLSVDSGFGQTLGAALGVGLFYFLSPLALALSSIATYGDDGTCRERHDGWFNPRRALQGTPSGGLPYLVGLVGAAALCGPLGLFSAGRGLGADYLAYVAYAFAFWGFFWAVARWASAGGAGLKAARTMTVSALVLVLALPLPLLSALQPNPRMTMLGSVWDLHVMRPVFGLNTTSTMLALVHAAFLALWAVVIFRRSEAIRRRKLEGAAVVEERTEPDLRFRLSEAGSIAEDRNEGYEVRA